MEESPKVGQGRSRQQDASGLCRIRAAVAPPALDSTGSATVARGICKVHI